MTESFTISAATTESSGLISPESQRGKQWQPPSSGYIRITSVNASIMKRSRLVSTRSSRSTREGEWPSGKSWCEHSRCLQGLMPNMFTNTAATGRRGFRHKGCPVKSRSMLTQLLCVLSHQGTGWRCEGAREPRGAPRWPSSWGASEGQGLCWVLVREEATGSKYLKISGRHCLFLLLLIDPEVAKPHLNASFLVGA